eukprot:Gb_06918 [translate_table: standard]
MMMRAVLILVILSSIGRINAKADISAGSGADAPTDASADTCAETNASTFDAVDGKQARRTNSSSPLGELFDHGCDALTCAFESMAFGSSVMSGRHTIWFWVIAAVPFYCATWER